LYHHTNRIDFVTRVDWHESYKLLKVSFPVDIRSSYATFEIQFGALDRATHNNTSWEQAQFEVCGHKWADLSEGGYGVSLLNDCKYGYDVKGNQLRLSLLRSPKWPDPHADQGMHEFTYAILPHGGDWRQGNVVDTGLALNTPLLCANTDLHSGRLPANHCFGLVEGHHVVLDTVKCAEDGDGIILRIYEALGARGPVSVKINWPVTAVWETNLLEEVENSVKVTDNCFNFMIRPYEIRTFKLQHG